MTDYQKAAIEALTDEVYAQFNFQYGDFNTPSEEEAESILAAAEPHLRKKWADEVRGHECHSDCGSLWRRGLLDAASIVEGTRK